MHTILAFLSAIGLKWQCITVHVYASVCIYGVSSCVFICTHQGIKYHYLFVHFHSQVSFENGGWSGGEMVLDKLPVPGHPTILIAVGQGPIELAVGAGGGLDIFNCHLSFLLFLPLFGRRPDN